MLKEVRAGSEQHMILYIKDIKLTESIRMLYRMTDMIWEQSKNV